MAAWWKVLEVDTDADLRSIKRAYAAKLKSIRQDEDPKGFMELREAYDIARRRVSVPQSVPEIIQTVDNDLDDFDDEYPTEPEIDEIDSLWEEAEKLLANPQNDTSDKDWQNILDDYRILDINNHVNFGYRLLHKLQDLAGYYDLKRKRKPFPLSQKTTIRIMQQFGWMKGRHIVYDDYEAIEFLAKKSRVSYISQKPKLKFTFALRRVFLDLFYLAAGYLLFMATYWEIVKWKGGFWGLLFYAGPILMLGSVITNSIIDRWGVGYWGAKFTVRQVLRRRISKVIWLIGCGCIGAVIAAMFMGVMNVSVN